jgi:DNA-binding protein HU-beta
MRPAAFFVHRSEFTLYFTWGNRRRRNGGGRRRERRRIFSPAAYKFGEKREHLKITPLPGAHPGDRLPSGNAPAAPEFPDGGGESMNKSELINQVAEIAELSKKDATRAVDAVFEAISNALQNGEKVQLVGFGNFEVRERSARKGRNPQTGEEIDIPASKIPAFKPGKSLRDACDQS